MLGRAENDEKYPKKGINFVIYYPDKYMDERRYLG